MIAFAKPLLGGTGRGDILPGTVAGLIAQQSPGYGGAICDTHLDIPAAEIAGEEHGLPGTWASGLALLVLRAIKQPSPR